jgi:hypothetical integral membrane protein (TIGR02206 family)
MFAVVSPAAYWSVVAVAAIGCAALSYAARRRPGAWRRYVAWGIGAALGWDIVAYSVGLGIAGTWSAKTDLPLALCNAGVVVASLACFVRAPLLVELTYFLGLAGTLQAVITPDLSVAFPHVVFFEYLVGHLGIVLAAVFLVAGLDIAPRRGAVTRVFVIAAGYTAIVGIVDALTGADYMFLRSPPREWTLLRLLGPWPWYVVSAAFVALVIFNLLDLPFRRARHLSEGTPRTPRPTLPVRVAGRSR